MLPAGRAADRLQPGLQAASLREARAAEGAETLVGAALRKAAAGIVDVREPLRLLLHEPR
jgi:hypothetical protein